MAETRRGGRSFAPLPPGIVRVRLEGESAPGLAARLASIDGASVITGPDEHPNRRVYLTVSLAEEPRPCQG